MKNALLLVLVLLVAALTVFAWRQSVELAAIALVRGPDESPLRLKGRLDEAEREIARLHGLLAKSAPPSGPVATNADPAAAASLIAAGETPPISPVNPLLRARMLGRIDRQFASLWRRLRFTPEQIQRYDNLLLEHRLSLLDFNRVAVEQGVGPANDPQAYASALGDVQDAAEIELASSLGPADFAQYQQYTQTLRQREIVDGSLQPFLSQAALPLTEGQADQLVQILARNPVRGNNLLSLPGLATVLTPEQFQALQRFQGNEPTDSSRQPGPAPRR